MKEKYVFDFTLTGDDVYDALRNTKKYRNSMIRAWIETFVLGGLAIFFGIWWLIWNDVNGVIFGICFAILIGLVWAAIAISTRNRCHKFVTGENIHAELTKDKLVLNGRVIQLNKSIVCKKNSKVLTLETDIGELTVIPIKKLEDRDEIEDIILDGTKSSIKERYKENRNERAAIKEEKRGIKEEKREEKLEIKDEKKEIKKEIKEEKKEIRKEQREEKREQREEKRELKEEMKELKKVLKEDNKDE